MSHLQTPENPDENAVFSPRAAHAQRGEHANGPGDLDGQALDGDGILDGQALDATPERPDAMPQENAQDGDWQPLDANLRLVVEAWPGLSAAARRAVVALVRQEAEGGGDD